MLMESLVNFFSIVSICFVLKDFFYTIGDILSVMEFKKKYVDIPWKILLYILSCSKCSTLWFSLIISGDLLVSCLSSLMIVLLEKWISPYLNETKLD